MLGFAIAAYIGIGCFIAALERLHPVNGSRPDIYDGDISMRCFLAGTFWPIHLLYRLSDSIIREL